VFSESIPEETQFWDGISVQVRLLVSAVFLALVADDPFSHSQLLPKEMVLEEHQLETWQAYMNEVTQPTGVAE